MIAIEYDDYLEIVRSLEKLKNKEDIDNTLNSLDKVIDKIRTANLTMNDGRD